VEETRRLSSLPSADPRKRGLGRGLGALLGRDTFDEGMIRDLPLHEIRLGRFQPRGEISEEDITDLRASIQDRGVLQPIVVRPVDDGYELVAGERRLRAAKAVGLQLVPAVVRHLSDQESLEIALLENLQREDLRPLEKARAYLRLQEEFGMTQEQIAGRLRKSQASVANTLRLLQLPDEVQESLQKAKISEGHARALLGLPHPQAVRDACREVERRGLSVRQTEALVRRWTISRGIRRRGALLPDPNLLAVQEDLSRLFQTKVAIRAGRRRGQILIDFYSPEDLNRVVALLLDKGGEEKTEAPANG